MSVSCFSKSGVVLKPGVGVGVGVGQKKHDTPALSSSTSVLLSVGNGNHNSFYNVSKGDSEKVHGSKIRNKLKTFSINMSY